VTRYAWPHGEAVGVGLLAAAKLSHQLRLCDPSLVSRVDDVLAQTGLPRSIVGLDPEAIYAAMSTDKKWKDGRSRFVLLRGVRQPFIMDDVGRGVVIDVLRQLQ